MLPLGLGTSRMLRAFSLMEEAVGRGLLPRYDPDAPLAMDMRGLPPAVAEVFCLNLLMTLERHANRWG